MSDKRTETEGPELLADALGRRGRTKAFCESVGLSVSTLAEWKRGVRPPPFWRKIMTAKLGIPDEAWDTAEERAKLDQMIADSKAEATS